MDQEESLESTFHHFARQLRFLSSDEHHTREVICALSAIPMLICIAQDVKNQRAADEALKALTQLSADQDAIEEMIDMGVLQMLLTRLNRYGNISPDTLKESLNLFLKVEKYMNDSRRVEVVNCGALSSLIHIIKLSDTTVAHPAGRLILALAVPSNLAYFQTVGLHLIEPLFIICTSNFESDIIDDSTSLLVKIMDKSQQPLYSMLDAASLLIRILSHCSRPVAQLNAALLLIELSKDPSFRRRILVVGGLAPLVMIKSKSSSKELQHAAGFLVADLTVREGLTFDETDLDL